MRLKVTFAITSRKDPVVIEVNTYGIPLNEQLKSIVSEGLLDNGTWYPPHRIKEATIEEIK